VLSAPGEWNGRVPQQLYPLCLPFLLIEKGENTTRWFGGAPIVRRLESPSLVREGDNRG